MSVSPRAKSALEHALVASRELDYSYVGPEHILIGLVEEGDGFAGELLRKLGLTSQSLRQKAVKVVGQGAEDGSVEGRSATPTLDKYARDLSELAKLGKLDPVIGRDNEIETIIEVLARRRKNNPVLIGEPGVGKTAIVEGLAQRIAQDQIPEGLRGKRVVELNINSVAAGAKYRASMKWLCSMRSARSRSAGSSMQLQRVQRTAAAQNIELSFDDAPRDHLARVGYDPEFGARMLKRKIRMEVESELADSLLRGDVRSGDAVEIRWDADEKAVRVKKLEAPESTGEEAKKAAEASA